MTFENFEETENHTQIRNILDNMREEPLSMSNYKKKHEKVVNTIQIIDAQIENDRKSYDERYSQFQEAKNSDHFEQYKQDNIVPIEMFKNVVSMIKTLKDALNWEMMKSTIYKENFEANHQLIEESNVVQTNRDAINEMREMEKSRNQAITEALGHKMAMFDERIITLIKQMQEDHRNDMRYVTMLFDNIIKGLNETISNKHLDKAKEMTSETNKQLNENNIVSNTQNFKRLKPQKQQNEEQYDTEGIPEEEVFDKNNDEKEESLEDIEKEFDKGVDF